MASFDNGTDFNTMRREALRRIEEMQSKSRNPAANSAYQAPPPAQLHSAPTKTPGIFDGFGNLFGGNSASGGILHNLMGNKPDSGGILHNLLGEKNGEQGGLLKALRIDEEKILIAMLLYILYKNKTDWKVLAALVYLLL
ncbi:MAG: hypothetical protein QM689_13155 [Oscillospiraceae bacterium]